MKSSRTVDLGSLSLSVTHKSLRHLDKFSIQFAYGQREILLDYAGIDRSNILVGILQHGVSQGGLTSDSPFTENNRAPRLNLLQRAPIWVFSENTKRHLKFKIYCKNAMVKLFSLSMNMPEQPPV